MQGFHNVPKKSGRVKSELIDVDLVRGECNSKIKLDVKKKKLKVELLRGFAKLKKFQ